MINSISRAFQGFFNLTSKQNSVEGIPPKTSLDIIDAFRSVGNSSTEYDSLGNKITNLKKCKNLALIAGVALAVLSAVFAATGVGIPIAIGAAFVSAACFLVGLNKHHHITSPKQRFNMI